MEEGLHLTERQQCGLVVCGLREVHHHTDMRTYVLTFFIYILSLVFRHPCPTLLTFAGMEIGIEHCQERTIFVEHFVGLHIGMVDRYLRVLLERDAIETGGQTEHPVDDLVQLEIGTQHLRVDIVFLQL